MPSKDLYTLCIVLFIVAFVCAFVGGLQTNRRAGLRECALRFRDAHTVSDSVQVVNRHPFCTNVL